MWILSKRIAFSLQCFYNHYNDVIMSAMASQITSLTIVYSTVYSGADQRKHQSSALLAFCVGNSPVTVTSVTRKMFPFDDVIMHAGTSNCLGPNQSVAKRNRLIEYTGFALHHKVCGTGYIATTRLHIGQNAMLLCFVIFDITSGCGKVHWRFCRFIRKCHLYACWTYFLF